MASSPWTVGRRSFRGDRRGVPSEELCGEASSSGGVRGDPLADRANERTIREDSVATGAVRVSKGCRVSSAAAVDCDVRRERAVEGSRFRGPRTPSKRLDGRGQQAVQEPVDALDSRGLEAILQLRLVKYADPETTMRSSTNCSNVRPKQQSTVTSQLRSTSGKVQTALQHDQFFELQTFMGMVRCGATQELLAFSTGVARTTAHMAILPPSHCQAVRS